MIQKYELKELGDEIQQKFTVFDASIFTLFGVIRRGAIPTIKCTNLTKPQLSLQLFLKWCEPGLNRRHMDFQSIALPTELPHQVCALLNAIFLLINNLRTDAEDILVHPPRRTELPHQTNLSDISLRAAKIRGIFKFEVRFLQYF